MGRSKRMLEELDADIRAHIESGIAAGRSAAGALLVLVALAACLVPA